MPYNCLLPCTAINSVTVHGNFAANWRLSDPISELKFLLKAGCVFESFMKSFLAVLRPTIIISAFGIII